MSAEVVVREEDTGGKLSFRFKAFCGEQVCGTIDAVKSKAGGRIVWRVDTVYVDEARRRQGIATKLYEAAAAEACRRRGRLASTARNHGAHSNSFWAKQYDKRRAIEFTPRGTNHPTYILRDCPAPRLDGIRRRR